MYRVLPKLGQRAVYSYIKSILIFALITCMDPQLNRLWPKIMLYFLTGNLKHGSFYKEEPLSWRRICLQCRRPGFDPWVGKIPWRRERLPTPVFWPREFHGLYRPWVHKESDMTVQLSLSPLSWSFLRSQTSWIQAAVFKSRQHQLSHFCFYSNSFITKIVLLSLITLFVSSTQ